MKPIKIILSFFIVAVLCWSCTSSQGDGKKPVKFTTHKEAVDTMRIVKVDSTSVVKKDSLPEIAVKYTELSKEAGAQLLSVSNFAKMLVSKPESDDYPVYNGFFGADNYRIEFFISDVKPDSANPYLLNVTGKCKFKKNITDFNGEIILSSISGYRDFNYDYSSFIEEQGKQGTFVGDSFSYCSHLKGTFRFAENASQKSAGVFTGDFFADIVKNESGNDNDNPFYFWFNTNNETRRAGFLLEGRWQSNNSNEVKQLICAKDFFIFANDILKDFSYGEREIEINAAYRNLGWDEYWENDEWWVDKDKEVMMNIWRW